MWEGLGRIASKSAWVKTGRGGHGRDDDTSTFCNVSKSSRPSRAEHHRLQRISRRDDGHTRLMSQTMVQPHQQRSAPGEHDSTLDDVGRKLRWRLVEREFDGVDDRLSRFLDRLPDLRAGEENGLGQASDEVSSATSADGSSAYGHADPTASLSCSAVRSPIRTLYSFLTQSMIAVSSSSPPTLIERETTMPPREMTATSVVPPPMSTTMDPAGSAMGSPDPMAAAIGSSMVYARRAPA